MERKIENATIGDIIYQNNFEYNLWKVIGIEYIDRKYVCLFCVKDSVNKYEYKNDPNNIWKVPTEALHEWNYLIQSKSKLIVYL